MKRVISVIVCAFLICSVFAACTESTDKKEKTQKKNVTAAELKYSYDSAYDFDGSIVSAYEALCAAVVNGDKEVRINTGFTENVFQLFYTSFPLNALVQSIDIKEDESGYSITYINDKAEHLRLVEAFKKKVAQIQAECDNGLTSDKARAIAVYNYVCENMNLVDENGINCYDAFINGKGNAFTYANMFEYLLQQYGIPAYHILAEDAGGAAWGLSAAELGGKLYYFDMAGEHYATDGKQLTCFGMTSEEVKASGLTNLIYTSREAAKNASDTEFDFCRGCVEWEIDGSNLLVTLKNGNVVEYAL